VRLFTARKLLVLMTLVAVGTIGHSLLGSPVSTETLAAALDNSSIPLDDSAVYLAGSMTEGETLAVSMAAAANRRCHAFAFLIPPALPSFPRLSWKPQAKS